MVRALFHLLLCFFFFFFLDVVIGPDGSDLGDPSRERVNALVGDSHRDHRLSAYHDLVVGDSQNTLLEEGYARNLIYILDFQNVVSQNVIYFFGQNLKI